MIKINRLFILIFQVITLTTVLTSCLKEDEELIDMPDGFYIKGKATAFTQFDGNGEIKPVVNEVTGQPREGLYGLFVAVSSEAAGFNVIEIREKRQTFYAPKSSEKVVLTGENGQIKATVQKGKFGGGSSPFTVSESGIYHIIIDKQTETYVISPVNTLSLSRKVSENSWIDTDIPLVSGFDKTNITFEKKGINLGNGDYRHRYGNGDRIFISGNEVSVSTFFGGILTGSSPVFKITMEQGGPSYTISQNAEGKYDMDVNWSVGGGFSAQLTLGDSGTYPEKLFMAGDGISQLTGNDAWNWGKNNFELIPAYSKSYLFWKIVWLNKTGSLRFAPLQNGEGSFGRNGNDLGGLYKTGDQDVPVPGDAGYYMVTVNLQTGEISVAAPAVFLIGATVNSWDVLNPLNRLNVDNSKKALTAFRPLSEGNLRMYAWNREGWFSNWWDAEFNLINGKIVYRGKGFNLPSVTITAGVYTLTLNFTTGEGNLERCACSD